VPSAVLAFVLPTSPLSVPRKPTADMGDDTMAEEVGWDGSGGLKVLPRRLTRGSRTQSGFFRSMAPRSVYWGGLKPRSMEREEGYDLDDELGRYAAKPTVRLAPRSTDGGLLTIVFTSFPGLLVRLGNWVVEPVPVCGCDACDETAEQEQARLESMVGDLTTGRLIESIRLRLWGDGWLVTGSA
jgi:Family of unknown function (DUF6226)